MFAYTVSCEFDDAAVADEWVAWLRDEHLADVCRAGATDAAVIRLDGAPVRCEVRYRFPSRAAALERFPLERGLRYHRSTGEVVAQLS